MSDFQRKGSIKGRGATLNPPGRFEKATTVGHDDGWSREDEGTAPHPDTKLIPETARSIISRNASPDIAFSQSINPYRGCEHGCIYCFARPSHAYVNLSPGLDFETKIFFKANAAALLEQELRHPKYVCQSIAIGTNTDPYQPAERKFRVMRSLLEVMHRYRQPVSIVTKGAALIERDLDILSEMARSQLAMVAISITSLKDDIKRTLEPRAAGSPAFRSW
jgi:DNA repair photolyase